jgi:hypothetical protein
MLPADIRKRIHTDFEPERANIIESDLEEFEIRFVEVYKDKPSPRIFRCLLYLASGDEISLARYSEVALSDWRDIILWAEYDKDQNRVFNGNRRFSFSK